MSNSSKVDLETLWDNYRDSVSELCRKNDNWSLDIGCCPNGCRGSTCHTGFRRYKNPQWIVDEGEEEMKTFCAINRRCWIAANLVVIAQEHGLDAAVLWRLQNS